MTLWAVGGRQDRPAGTRDRDHAALFDEARLVDVEGGRVRLRYTGPFGRGHCFKGIAGDGDQLWICTEGEVLTLGAAGQVEGFTHPSLNDVHHAAVLGGIRHVVSTGADGVLVGDRFMPLGPRGRVPDTDLRGLDLRPHRIHPNHVFAVDDEVWITCGILGSAVCLGRGDRWALADCVVHDGVVCPDGVWFTAVDGRLLRVDPSAGRVVETVDLAPLGDRDPPLGWCRGLAIVDGIAWVGFTQLRATRWRRNLAWLRGSARRRQVVGRHPTRVVAYDLRARRAVAEILLGDLGLDAVFGLLAGEPMQLAPGQATPQVMTPS